MRMRQASSFARHHLDRTPHFLPGYFKKFRLSFLHFSNEFSTSLPLYRLLSCRAIDIYNFPPVFTFITSSSSSSSFPFLLPCPSEYIKYFDRYYQLYISILYLYIYIDIYIYIYVYIYIPIPIYVRIRVYIYIYIHTYIYIRAHRYIHTCIHTYIYSCHYIIYYALSHILQRRWRIIPNILFFCYSCRFFFFVFFFRYRSCYFFFLFFFPPLRSWAILKQ